MSNKVDFGVLYGQKTTEDALLIYSSYEDAKASPYNDPQELDQKRRWM